MQRNQRNMSLLTTKIYNSCETLDNNTRKDNVVLCHLDYFSPSYFTRTTHVAKALHSATEMLAVSGTAETLEHWARGRAEADWSFKWIQGHTPP